MADGPYRRVLLKLSGEVFGGSGNLDVAEMERIAAEVRSVRDAGIEVAVVVGGGNFLRGAEISGGSGLTRAAADQMGMLATVMNGLALQDIIERDGVEAPVASAIEMTSVCDPFVRRQVVRHLAARRIPILVAGTGHPYFTTDTTAALRAKEIGADALLKATKVDGVYTADPKKDSNAERVAMITHKEAIDRGLGVMDLTALALCHDTRMPIVVFDLTVPGNVLRAARGENIGTIVSHGGT